MVDKVDFEDIDSVLRILKESQESEQDLRQHAREAHHFIDKRDGQWNPDDTHRFKDKPRMTFDKCGPIVDQIAGEMQNAEFTIRISPAGGDASIDIAKTYDGLIRNIKNISNADHIFNEAGRSMITAGMDGWEVVQQFIDGNSFDQDLMIKKIPNFIDRVWFDVGSEMQDRSDAMWCIVLQTIPRAEYEKRWPETSAMSVGDDRRNEVYNNKADVIVVGRILFKKKTQRELVLMTNGRVYEDDEDFKKVSDELRQFGVVEKNRRTRDTFRVWSRLFNGQEWLKKAEETVFDFIPVIPTYGNFKISENKLIFRGVVEKLIDPQRYYNFLKSRQAEEVSLAPRGKFFLTREQAEKDTATLATLNTNSDPAQTYTHIDGQPPPFWQGGAQVNQALEIAASGANQDLSEAAGLFSANMANNPGLQSGVAIGKQIDKGDNGTVKWFQSQEVAICQTAKVLINAIPRVYDSERQIRLIGEDGTSSTITIFQKIQDQQTGEVVELNDLSQGQYDAVCLMGAAFKSRQSETVRAFLDMATIDPSIMEVAKDIFLKNQESPGMDLVSERFRIMLLNQGVIPESQWTDEERQKIQEAQQAAQEQPPQEDPNLLIAQAEMGKAQAELQNAQTRQQEAQANLQIKVAQIEVENNKVDLEREKLQLNAQKFELSTDVKFNVDAAKIEQGQQKIDLDSQKQEFQQLLETVNQRLDTQKAASEEILIQAQTFKTLVEGMGADAFIGPGITKATIDQAQVIQKSQEDKETL